METNLVKLWTGVLELARGSDVMIRSVDLNSKKAKKKKKKKLF